MKWISVKDKQPTNQQDGDEFMVVLNGEVYSGIWSAFEVSEEKIGFYLRNFDTDYGGLFHYGDITDWMEFPAPPNK